MEPFDVDAIFCSECGILIEDYEPEVFCGDYVCTDCMDFKDAEDEDEHEEWLKNQL